MTRRGGGARRDRAKKPALHQARSGSAQRSGSAPGPGPSSRWTRWIAYALLGIFACYWGSKVFTEHRIGNYAVETDFYWKYGPAARDLLQGKVDIANYDSKGWGYPVAVALVSILGVEPFQAAQAIAILSAILVGFLAYRIHRSLLGPAAALCALLLLLSNETFLANTYEVGTDMFFFAIVLGSIVLRLGKTRPNTLALLGSGLLGGWAFSTRYNGLFLWPGALVLLLALRTVEGNARARIQSAAIWSGGFVAAALPWLLVNAVHTGNPLTNSNYVNVGYAVYGEGNWEKFFYGGNRKITSFVDVVRLDPARFIGVMAKNLVEHLRRDLSELVPLLWGVLAVLGGLLMLREHTGRRVAGFAVLWGLYFFTLVPVFYGTRFSLPLLAFYFLFAVWPFFSPTIGKPVRSLERSFPARVFVFLGLWLLTAVQAYQWTEDPQNGEQLRAGPYDIAPAISFLRGQAGDEGVIARKPHAAFLSKRPFILLPRFDSPDSLHSVAVRDKARYLLVSGAELSMRPEMRSFASGTDIAGFVRVFESPGALVYEVRPYASP